MVVASDIHDINKVSPYIVEQKSEGRYTFRTKYGVRYVVDFAEENLWEGVEMYQFSIININNKPSPNDTDVRDTIIAVVNAFFSANQSVLLYLCETADGKQKMRDRLFRNWFARNTEKQQYLIISADVKDSEDVINYAAIILRKDHPDRESIVRLFKDTVETLSNKPE